MESEMTDKQAIKRLIGLLAKYKIIICIIIGTLLFTTLLNLCIPLISRRIMDEGFIGGDGPLLVKLAVISFLLYAVITALNLLVEKLRINIAAKIQYSLNEEAFRHLMQVQIEYYDNRNYAETFSNLNMDIANMTSIADEGMFFVITQIFSIIGGIVGLFILDYRMTIIVLLIIPVKYLAMKYFAKKRKSVMDSFINAGKAYAGWFGDTVGGIREVRLLGIINEKNRGFAQKQNKIITEQKRLNMLSQWNMGIDSIIVQIMVMIIYIVGANLVFGMELTVGTVFAFITYSAYVTGPIAAILNIKYLLSGIIPSTKRYYDFMAMPEEGETKGEVIPQWNDLSFDKVTFSYLDENPVIDNVSINISKGMKIAIVGRNGCGKSTLMDLLLRLRVPQEGYIRLGNVKIDTLPMVTYREMFAVVSQEVYLFNDSIRNNICLFRDIDETDIIKACEDSGLTDFISEVGLDYIVGQNGAMLSGGQKQKVALTRALLMNRPVFILDEATSNVDASSELRINKLLHTRLKDKTVIVISHRKSVLEEMDQVILMDEGRVVEAGDYKAIASTNIYRKVMVEKYLPHE